MRLWLVQSVLIFKLLLFLVAIPAPVFSIVISSLKRLHFRWARITSQRSQAGD